MSDITIAVPTAQIIIDYRTRMNLSRKDLADLTGLTQAVIWRLEHVPAGEEKEADDESRNKISAALVAYEQANPTGKPKATKKAPKAAKPDTNTQAVADLSQLVLIIKKATEDEFDKAKAKKASTAGYARIINIINDAKLAIPTI